MIHFFCGHAWSEWRVQVEPDDKLHTHPENCVCFTSNAVLEETLCEIVGSACLSAADEAQRQEAWLRQ